jgi:hypothetical protein
MAFLSSSLLGFSLALCIAPQQLLRSPLWRKAHTGTFGWKLAQVRLLHQSPMKIILDSTALRRDYFLSSPDARLLELYVTKTQSSVLVPTVVVDEVQNLYREDLREVNEKLVSRYRQLLGTRAPKLPELDIEQECEAYRTQILADIKEKFRGIVLPYPQLSHEDLVKRDLARRKPFNPAGKGYRDALIWASILAYLSSTKETACLISNNTKDLWSTDGKRLHEDLAEELRTAKFPQQLAVFTGIDDFNKTVVNPTLKRLESISEQLRTGTFESLDLKELLKGCRSDVKQVLKAERMLSQLIRSQIGGRANFEDVSLSEVGEPYDIEIQDVFELDRGKIFLHFTVVFDVTLEVVVPGDDMLGWRSVSPPWANRLGDSEDAAVQIDAELPAYFSATAVYNVADEDVETLDIEPDF